MSYLLYKPYTSCLLSLSLCPAFGWEVAAEMSVPFSYTHVRVPRGFGAILEDLAREVLRDQPDDIPTYAAKHFRALLKARDESGEDPVEWAARLESRFNNKCSVKSPGNQRSTGVRTQAEVKSTPPDRVEDKEPEDTQPAESFTLSPLAPDQEEALDSAAQMGPEAADEAEPPAEGQCGGFADVDICAQELKGGGGGSTVGGEAEEREEDGEGDEDVEEVKKGDGEVEEAGVGDGKVEEGRGDEEAGEEEEEVEEKAREEDEEVEGARKGDEEVDEARGGDEADVEDKAGQGDWADVEDGEYSAHTDADISRSELEPSSVASIGGLANVDVCAAELEGQPDDQDPMSEGSVKERSSLEASGSQLEVKKLSASQGQMETPEGLTDLRAISPEHSHTPLEKHPAVDGPEDDGSEVIAEQQTCLEGQLEEPQEASAISEVTQEQKSEQEEHKETEADAANSGGASDGGHSPGVTDGEPGLGDGDGERSHGYGDGERSHGDGDGEGRNEDGDGEHSHGDGDGGRSHGDGDGEHSHGDGDGGRSHGDGDGERSHGDGYEEGVYSELDSHVEKTDTDKHDSHEELSGRRSAEKSAGHTSGRHTEEGKRAEKEDEEDDDDEVTETDKDVQASTLQDVSEIESTQRGVSDDECDVTQAAGQLDEHTLISQQREFSADGEGKESEKEGPEKLEQESTEKPEEERPKEESPGVSHSLQQDASEEVGGRREQEASSEEVGGGESAGKKEGEVKGDQGVQEGGGEETDLTVEGSLERSLSDPAGGGSLRQSVSGGPLDDSHSMTHTAAEEHCSHAGDSTQTPDPQLDQSKEHNQDQSEHTHEGGAREEKSCGDKGDPKRTIISLSADTLACLPDRCRIMDCHIEECNQPGDEEDIMDIPLDDPEANRAAAKIQAGFRGHMTRKKMPRKDDKPGEEVSSSGEALNGNQGNTGASEEAETEGTSAPEQ
ncbi:hypothetical protein ACEWY4_018720 [Coilia grayii]|uniref:RIIa domain-containing protein n=1 Tax=Coilia grayii TaxID=363190 RepID=A0ABD1JE05_9TELE